MKVATTRASSAAAAPASSTAVNAAGSGTARPLTVVVPAARSSPVTAPAADVPNDRQTVLHQRKAVADEVEGMLDAHPLAPVLISMPGIGVRTAARIPPANSPVRLARPGSQRTGHPG